MAIVDPVSLSHVMFFAYEVEKTAQWYVDTLGYGVVYGSPHYTILTHPTAGSRLDLHGAEPGAGEKCVGCGPEIYHDVADIDAAVAALRAAGVEVTEPRSEGGSPRFASLQDPEGNRLGLVERRPA